LLHAPRTLGSIINRAAGLQRVEWLFVLFGIVAVWQFVGLVRDLWYMLRQAEDERD